MGYGDFQFFDIIIFAAIAAFLVFRLRKVLGRRTGHEKGPREDLNNIKNSITDKDKEKYTHVLDDNFVELHKAYEVLEDFDHKNFLEGAKIAFETIIDAFNKSDKKTLRNMLTDEVYKVFEKEINANNNDSESQIFSLNIESIENTSINQDKITIKVKFISEHFRNNDEKTITKKEDVWSFEKLIKSTNPNWLLSLT